MQLQVCPICAARVGLDLVGHITTQHGSFFKMQYRRRFRRGSPGSHSMLSLLRKDLREGNLQSLLGGSSYMAPPSAAAPDPFCQSLIYTLPVAEAIKEMYNESLDEGSLVNKSLDEKVAERVEPSLSDEDQKERARRREFVQELVLSTIFDDTL
ncbi:LOW QUALITY PROTEIN: protein DEHYDRATION-INDUCED 19 homolog 2-like [Phoenix dactylifera]|uniref:LOW QUALITY PROTEIN: protein DEHYDRATION-INDUCED 19 homolog 2-like n=1 Tax=Phoenix dactylifera TaxID=42345 RepID=A0A8B9A5H7_PHODC|nr:LOW QUALITY PROTEIN: protein DEHYDRATION-INDUCED 19 homolog 2-like [Phoenix dactylifera]